MRLLLVGKALAKVSEKFSQIKFGNQYSGEELHHENMQWETGQSSSSITSDLDACFSGSTHTPSS